MLKQHTIIINTYIPVQMFDLEGALKTYKNVLSIFLELLLQLNLLMLIRKP